MQAHIFAYLLLFGLTSWMVVLAIGCTVFRGWSSETMVIVTVALGLVYLCVVTYPF